MDSNIHSCYAITGTKPTRVFLLILPTEQKSQPEVETFHSCYQSAKKQKNIFQKLLPHGCPPSSLLLSLVLDDATCISHSQFPTGNTSFYIKSVRSTLNHGKCPFVCVMYSCVPVFASSKDSFLTPPTFIYFFGLTLKTHLYSMYSWSTINLCDCIHHLSGHVSNPGWFFLFWVCEQVYLRDTAGSF